MTKRKSKTPKAVTSAYAVRVGEQFVVGFRYPETISDGKKTKTVFPPPGPDERKFAEWCIARLGPGEAYVWDSESAAKFVADAIGGVVAEALL
jgi:hypothetical protein